MIGIQNSCYGVISPTPTLLDRIPQYAKIINDLSKGNLNMGYFDMKNRKSRLSRTLDEILFDANNDELSIFILFMDAHNVSDLVKFLLDLTHFESSVRNRKTAADHHIVDEKNKKTAHSTLDEALAIFKKYISKDSTLSVKIPDTLITETITRICPENGAPIQQDCFASVKELVLTHIQNQFFDKYVMSEYHHKYVLDLLDTQNLTLYDILYDDLAVVFFLEYLEQENVSDLLKFLVQAEMFTRNMESLKVAQDSKLDLKSLCKQWQDDAMVIYDNFISLQAKRPIGFDSLIRRQVELNISIDLDDSSETSDVHLLMSTYSKCFFVPTLIAFCILDKVYFDRFLASVMFNKYKTEIRLNTRSSRASITSCSSSLLEQPDQAELLDEENNVYNSKQDQQEELRTNCHMPQPDSIWNLSEPSIGEVHVDASNSYSLANFKKKFAKFRKTLIGLNKRRYMSLPNNEHNDYDHHDGYGGGDEEDEYEMAEKVAAQLINDVIRANQLHN